MWFSWNKTGTVFEFDDIILYSSANLSKFLFITLCVKYGTERFV